MTRRLLALLLALALPLQGAARRGAEPGRRQTKPLQPQPPHP